MAEMEEFSDKEFLYSDPGIYPIQGVDTSEFSNWIEIWGPEQIKDWQNEDKISKFRDLKATLDNKPNRQTIRLSSFSHEVRIFCQMWEEFE